MRRTILILAAAGIIISGLLAQPSQIHAQALTCTPRVDWTTTYRVAPGENLFRIAQRYGLSTAELALGNCIANVNRIFAGQTLRVPGPPSTGSGSGSSGGNATWFPLPSSPVPLYSAPSQRAPRIVLLKSGSIRLLGRSADSNWIMVQASSGQNGWVMTNDAMIQSSFVTPLPIFGAGVTTDNAYIDEDGVRLRSGPGFQYGIRRFLSRQQLQVVGRTADSSWLRVYVFGMDGWVYAAYVSIDPALVAQMPIAG